jgi:hypothetical protein
MDSSSIWIVEASGWARVRPCWSESWALSIYRDEVERIIGQLDIEGMTEVVRPDRSRESSHASGSRWVKAYPVHMSGERPEVLMNNVELLSVLQGNPHGVADLNGDVTVTVRMYTTEEIIEAQRRADERLSAETGIPRVGPLSRAQAADLTRRLPSFSSRTS